MARGDYRDNRQIRQGRRHGCTPVFEPPDLYARTPTPEGLAAGEGHGANYIACGQTWERSDASTFDTALFILKGEAAPVRA